MRTPRIFIDLPLTDRVRVTLPAAAARHVSRVLRLRVGALLTVFNGEGGEYSARICHLRGEDTEIEIERFWPTERESSQRVILLQAVARGERMDLVVQKTTELGISRVLPVTTVRSVVQLADVRASKRQTHWRAVAIAACEQCGRNRLPVIDPVRPLSEALETLETLQIERRWLLDPQASTGPATLLAQPPVDTGIVLLIGPEGGLDDQEINMAREQGFIGVRLGPRILRTETAALAALAAIQSLAGDYR